MNDLAQQLIATQLWKKVTTASGLSAIVAIPVIGDDLRVEVVNGLALEGDMAFVIEFGRSTIDGIYDKLKQTGLTATFAEFAKMPINADDSMLYIAHKQLVAFKQNELILTGNNLVHKPTNRTLWKKQVTSPKQTDSR